MLFPKKREGLNLIKSLFADAPLKRKKLFCTDILGDFPVSYLMVEFYHICLSSFCWHELF